MRGGALFQLPLNMDARHLSSMMSRERRPITSSIQCSFFAFGSMEIPRSRRPPGFDLFFYHGDRTVQLLLNHEGDEGPQTLF